MRKIVLLAALAFFVALFGRAEPAHAAAPCTHYASPTGGGNGSSAAQPFRVSNFWAVARPGATLCLLDGAYTGSSSMVNPPQNLSGSAAAPITVRALNDGRVTVNGQGSAVPVRLYYNNYFVIEGINARSSAESVVSLSRSNNNIVRRVAAWDAADANHMIFAVNSGTHNLLEDVAGWGIARKIFSASQGGDSTTIRRAWGRWEGSHVIGPKMTYTLAYNNVNMLIENAIGTWSGERMQSTYVLRDYSGNAWTGSGAGTYTNHGVDQAYGIFGNDGFTGSDKNARSKLLGSIAYIRAADRFAPAQTVMITKVDSLQIANTVAYIESGSHASKKPFALMNLQTARGSNLVANNLTAIGGAPSSFGSDWQRSAIVQGASTSSVANVFSSQNGANVCFRYQNGRLTDQPLWPWPMNQRIIEATAASGRAAVDVTRTIESMLGPIPAACRTGAPSAPVASAPSAPTNLTVTP